MKDFRANIQFVSPEKLTPYSKNAKIHTEEAVDKLAHQISEFGFDQPIVVDESYVIIKGHRRLRAAQKLRLKEVPIIVSSLSEYQAIAARIADNKLGLMGTFDEDLLQFDLGTLSRNDFDTKLTAMDQGDVDRLLKDVPTYDEKPKSDKKEIEEIEVPEKVEAKTKPGDLIILGRHRLLCGSSIDRNDVNRLIEGREINVTITDPPYNVGIEYGPETDDKKSEDDYEKWSQAWFELCPSESIVFTPGTNNFPMWYRIKKPKHMCIWRKANQSSNSPLGGFNTWEPLLVYGKTRNRIGHDSWDMPVSKHKFGHPVNKCINAWKVFVEAFSKPNDVIYEPFGGSGTTLVIAEQIERTVYSIEISPHFCDIIIARWEKLTGEKAEIKNI